MIRRLLISTALAAAWLPSAAQAIELAFPINTAQSAQTVEDYGSYHLPISAWQDGDMQTLWCEGQLTQQAWKIPATGLTTLQILTDLKAQVTAAGFEVIFECETEACGGFDFRYETAVLPEPDMHVDLGDFRFLAAQRMGEEKPEYLSLLISRNSTAGFVQLTRVGPQEPGQAVVVTSTKSPDLAQLPIDGKSLPKSLEKQGYFVLEDLDFATGSAALGDGSYTTLAALAEYLNANPDRQVALVGHTDAEGSLAGNIALSKKRAGSVVARLVDKYGVDRGQLSAEGMGFLSPRASNLTTEGRTQNRRVEVILTSTE